MGFLFQPMQSGNPFASQLLQTIAPFMGGMQAPQQAALAAPTMSPEALARQAALQGFESQVRGINTPAGTADWFGQWEALRPQWTSVGYAPYQIEQMMRNQLLGGDVFTGAGVMPGAKPGADQINLSNNALNPFVTQGANPFAPAQQQAAATFANQPSPETRATNAFKLPKLENPFSLPLK